jgi:FKBP-type peptidyl-prolyl cis-trans isomerase 2
MALPDGTTVRVHYRGTLADGSEFDNSHQRGEPIEFTLGGGQVISGFDEAVREMSVGDSVKVTIPVENAYGPRFDEALQEVPLAQLPEGVCEGAMLSGMTEEGQPVAGTVKKVDGDTATVDFNHPLAGEDLTFELDLVEVVEG